MTEADLIDLKHEIDAFHGDRMIDDILHKNLIDLIDLEITLMNNPNWEDE